MRVEGNLFVKLGSRTYVPVTMNTFDVDRLEEDLLRLKKENNKLKKDIEILKCNGDCVVCNEWLIASLKN